MADIVLNSEAHEGIAVGPQGEAGSIVDLPGSTGFVPALGPPFPPVSDVLQTKTLSSEICLIGVLGL